MIGLTVHEIRKWQLYTKTTTLSCYYDLSYLKIIDLNKLNLYRNYVQENLSNDPDPNTKKLLNELG